MDINRFTPSTRTFLVPTNRASSGPASVSILGLMPAVQTQPLIHAICTYHGQWMPGDERGWPSRGHRLHSSGDYRSRPPLEEHVGLHRSVRARMKSRPVQLRGD